MAQEQAAARHGADASSAAAVDELNASLLALKVDNSRLEEEKKAAALAADNAEARAGMVGAQRTHEISLCTPPRKVSLSSDAHCRLSPMQLSFPPVSFSFSQRESKKKISESKQFQEYKRILKNKSEELKKVRTLLAAPGATLAAREAQIEQKERKMTTNGGR